MRLGAVLLIGAIVLFAGCGDSTSPPATHVDVTVALAAAPVIEQPSPLETTIRCEITFRARASGGGTARWVASWLVFYAGPDRSSPLDSIEVSETNVRSGWQAGTIESGQEQFSTWVFTASAPFGIRFRFGYMLSDGSVRDASASHTCGPPVPAGTTEPTITAPTIEPSSGEVESGDTLTLTFNAASPVGLWETRILFSGPCNWQLRTPEHFLLSISRTVKLPVPAACPLGDALRINIQVFDIALRGVQVPVPMQLTVVDRTPPRVAMTFGFYGSPVPTGFYFGGDTMPAYLGAVDNHALRAVYREVMSWGRQDSLLGSGTIIDRRIDIPIPEDWVGGMQVRAFSRDAAALTSDTIVASPDSFRIYPTIRRSMQSVTTTDAIYDVIFDESRGLLYLRHPDALRITVLSASDLTESASIPLPGPAYDFDLSARGDTMVLALGTMGALGIIDVTAASRTVAVLPLTTLNTAFSQHPVRVRLAANGKALVVLDGATYLQTTLLEVDPVGRGERLRTDAGDNGVVGYVTLERSNDHQVIVVSGDGHSQRYDAPGDAFGPVRNVSGYPHQVRVDATGTRIALGLSVFDAALQFERRVESPVWDPSAAVALSPDGRILYQYSLPHGIVRSDASDGHLMDRIRTPGVGLMRFSPDGTKLALVSWKTIGLMDLR